MLKDIKETPQILGKLLSTPQLENDFGNINNIYIAASGSSRNVANTAKPFLEKIAGIPVIIDYAGEFAHRTPVLRKNDLFIPLSQSGETADVISALNKAKDAGVRTFSITNKDNSTIQKMSDSGMLVYAGEEVSIPATKSFSGQLLCLYLLALHISGKKIDILQTLPEKISNAIENQTEIDKLAEVIKNCKSLIILGRGQNCALADEAALKIKETSYINATGYPTGEFLHGHLAVLDEEFPVLSILSRCFDDAGNYALAIKNTEEIRKKRNPIMLELNHAEQDEVLAPFITTIMIQLLAYKIATLLGRDTDKPRSLNKTVNEE